MPIRWLHLSDLHFRPDDWKQQGSLAPLLEQLPDLVGDGLGSADLILVTGDVANSGKPDEYKVAGEWLATLADKMGLDPKQRLFIVPGNHDVDRAKVSRITSLAKRQLVSIDDHEALRSELGDLLGNPSTLHDLAKPLEAFFDFQRQLCGYDHACSTLEPSRTVSIDIATHPCSISLLCSPIFSDSTDRPGELFLGERPIRAAIDANRESSALHLVLMHHPFNWFAQGDGSSCRRLLLTDARPTIVLNGHLHDQEAISLLSGSAALLTISAGSCYPGSRWKHGFITGEYDPEDQTAHLAHYTFSREPAQRWHTDAGATRAGHTEVHQFRLSDAPRPTPDRSVVLSSLATATRRVYRRMRLAGFPAHVISHEPELADIFVEQELRAVAGNSTRTLSSLRDVVSAKEPLRIAITGSPGAGKSTLMAHLATSASVGRATVLLRAVELNRSLEASTFLTSVCRVLRESLDVTVSPDTLRALLTDGSLTVLVDAVDEAGDTARFIEALSEWADAYPATTVVVSARSIDFARMKKLHDRFELLEVQPLGDEQVGAFLKNWANALSTLGTKERNDSIRDLVETLEFAPAIRAMMRNPLLATLITMVHWSVGSLPSHRARVYEMCVDLLLEAWPSRAGKTFDGLNVVQQKRLLYDFARHLIGERSSSSANSSIPKSSAITYIAEQLKQNTRMNSPSVIAAQWIEHLIVNTGLLSPAGDGDHVQFSHLTFLEYLAARGILNAERPTGYKHVAGLVAEGAGTISNEVWLLLLGSASEDAALIDQCVKCVLESCANTPSPVFKLPFLFDLLRDDIPISPSLVDEILSVSRSSLSRENAWPKWIDAAVWGALRFGTMYAEQIGAYAQQHLCSDSGDDLQKTALLFGPVLSDATKTTWLGGRGDRDEALLTILDLFPLGGCSFAFDHLPPSALIEWASARPVMSESSIFIKVMGAKTTAPYALYMIHAILRRTSLVSEHHRDGFVRGGLGSVSADIPRNLTYETKSFERSDRKASSPELNGGMDLTFELHRIARKSAGNDPLLCVDMLDSFVGNPSLVAQAVRMAMSIHRLSEKAPTLDDCYAAVFRGLLAMSLPEQRTVALAVEMTDHPVGSKGRWRSNYGLEPFIRYALDCSYGLSVGGEVEAVVRGENRWFVEVGEFVSEMLRGEGVDHIGRAGYIAMSISSYQTTHEWPLPNDAFYALIDEWSDVPVIRMLVAVCRWIGGYVGYDEMLSMLNFESGAVGAVGQAICDWASASSKIEMETN